MRFLGFLFLLLFAGCSSLRNTPKYELVDGIYNLNNQKVIVENVEDSIHVFSTGSNSELIGNSLPPTSNSLQPAFLFQKSTFDLDLLAIPVKIHGSRYGIPSQLLTEINASVYLGRRSDLFYIRYKKTPRNLFKREVDHFGFSFGGFLGFGSSAIHNGVSLMPIATDYQGITFSKGIAGIFAINDFTLGIAYGFDQLLDENASSWIYNQKPYFGVAIGLNLN